MIQAALDWIRDVTGLGNEGAEIVLMIGAVYALATLAGAVGQIFQIRVKV